MKAKILGQARYVRFERFQLDVLDERLWVRHQSVPLGRKAFAVLQRLLSQPGLLVTKGRNFWRPHGRIPRSASTQS